MQYQYKQEQIPAYSVLPYVMPPVERIFSDDAIKMFLRKKEYNIKDLWQYSSPPPVYPVELLISATKTNKIHEISYDVWNSILPLHLFYLTYLYQEGGMEKIQRVIHARYTQIEQTKTTYLFLRDFAEYQVRLLNVKQHMIYLYFYYSCWLYSLLNNSRRIKGIFPFIIYTGEHLLNKLNDIVDSQFDKQVLTGAILVTYARLLGLFPPPQIDAYYSLLFAPFVLFV